MIGNRKKIKTICKIGHKKKHTNSPLQEYYPNTRNILKMIITENNLMILDNIQIRDFSNLNMFCINSLVSNSNLREACKMLLIEYISNYNMPNNHEEEDKKSNDITVENNLNEDSSISSEIISTESSNNDVHLLLNDPCDSIQHEESDLFVSKYTKIKEIIENNHNLSLLINLIDSNIKVKFKEIFLMNNNIN